MGFPSPLRELVDEFAALPWDLKLEYLADYAEHLPAPDRATAELTFTPVPECQSPLSYSVHVTDNDTVTLAFAVAGHAVTAHGFVGLLHAGLNGVSRADIVAIDTDLPEALRLTEHLSPQRLVGLRAVLFRIQQSLAADVV